jgi:hypothetical protein
MTTHRPALTQLATRTVDIHNGVIQHLTDDPQSRSHTQDPVSLSS